MLLIWGIRVSTTLHRFKAPFLFVLFQGDQDVDLEDSSICSYSSYSSSTALSSVRKTMQQVWNHRSFLLVHAEEEQELVEDGSSNRILSKMIRMKRRLL